jgi:hypothetical protein
MENLDLLSTQDMVSETSFRVNSETVTLLDAFNAVDTVLERLNATNDDDECVATVRSFVGMHVISGSSLAKLLFGWQAWWVERGGLRDNFIDRCMISTGIGRTTIERYTQVWARLHVENIIPTEFRDEVQGRPLKDQIAIANALSQGYVIEDDDWKRLAQAANNSEILSIVREATGRPPRSTATTLFLERDGSINAWTPSGISFVGFLNVKEEADEVVAKAIKRIIDGSGLIRR